LIEGSCAIAGVILPDNGVDRVVDEVSFHRKTKLREDIVASLEIVPNSRIENRFAVDGLIAKTGAPRLEEVHADGGAKDRAFVGAEKILKRARGVVGGVEWDGF
jgi:hypothetical protein